MRELGLAFWLFQFLGLICIGLLVHSIVKDWKSDNTGRDNVYDENVP